MRGRQVAHGSLPTVSLCAWLNGWVPRAKNAIRLDTDRDGWIQVNYEEFMRVRSRVLLLA